MARSTWRLALAVAVFAGSHPALAEGTDDRGPLPQAASSAPVRVASLDLAHMNDAGSKVPLSIAVEAAKSARERAKEARKAKNSTVAAETTGSVSPTTAQTAEKPAPSETGRLPGGTRALAVPAGATGIRALIAKHAAEQGVPVALADAVIRVESRYNPRARNGIYVGLSQISPRTARGIGYNGSVQGLFDPDTNLRYGLKYLAQAYRLAGGDTCGAVMRYQSGHGAKRMNGANRVYCSKVRTIIASR